jgi:hypothetical protein
MCLKFGHRLGRSRKARLHDPSRRVPSVPAPRMLQAAKSRGKPGRQRVAGWSKLRRRLYLAKTTFVVKAGQRLR